MHFVGTNGYNKWDYFLPLKNKHIVTSKCKMAVKLWYNLIFGVQSHVTYFTLTLKSQTTS